MAKGRRGGSMAMGTLWSVRRQVIQSCSGPSRHEACLQNACQQPNPTHTPLKPTHPHSSGGLQADAPRLPHVPRVDAERHHHAPHHGHARAGLPSVGQSACNTVPALGPFGFAATQMTKHPCALLVDRGVLKQHLPSELSASTAGKHANMCPPYTATTPHLPLLPAPHAERHPGARARQRGAARH